MDPMRNNFHIFMWKETMSGEQSQQIGYVQSKENIRILTAI